MKIKKFLPILLVLSFTGCGNQKLTEGEIYKKEFTPAHEEIRFVPVVISNGKSIYTYMIPYQYNYSDSYCIGIREYDEENNDWETANYYVSRDVYDACEIGGTFEYDKDRDYEEVPYTRETIKAR